MDSSKILNEDHLLNLLDQALEKNIEDAKVIDLHRDVILYGAGNLGKMAIDLLRRVKITPKYIVDRNESNRGCNLMGINIIMPEDISRLDCRDPLIVVCVVTVPYFEIANYLRTLGIYNIVHFYDVTEALGERLGMTNGWRYSSLTNIDKGAIKQVFNNWADLISRAHYIMVLYWRLHRQEINFNEAPVTGHDRLFPPDIMPPFAKNEVFIDCGAYEGDTIKRIIVLTQGIFSKIIAFEPDAINYLHLQNYVNGLEPKIKNRIYLNHCGIGDKNEEIGFLSHRGMASRFSDTYRDSIVRMVRLDDAKNIEFASFVKMHLEGFEFPALTGAIKYLQNCRPIIVVTLYHSEEGIWKIPLLLMKNLKNYYFYHRVHAYCGNSSILYGVPTERQHTNPS